MTILQWWSQGVEVWGREGMRKLWSAATVKVYGGGVSEVGSLTELSALIGRREPTATSTSTSRRGRSTSRSTTREKVLDLADLAALSRGRAVVLASGSRPTLVQTLPWMAGPTPTPSPPQSPRTTPPRPPLPLKRRTASF